MVAGGSEGGWGIAGGAVGCVQDGRAAASRRFVDRRSPGSPVKVTNVHERLLPASPARVGQPLDSLAGPDDRLWPLHDALIEDALAEAARHLAVPSPRPRWSLWVRALRGVFRRRRTRRAQQ